MQKKGIAILLACAMVLGVAACGKQQVEEKTAAPAVEVEETEEAEETKEPLKVVFTITHQNNEFTVGLGEQFLKEGAARGHDVSLVSADLDSATQISQMETAVTQGADAIVVFSVSTDSLTGGLQAAKDADVPVFTIHSGVTDESMRVCHVGSDLVEGGKIKTEQMIKDLQELYPNAEEIQIGSMLGGIGSQTQIDITEGECQALGYEYSASPSYPIETSTEPRIKIVVQDTANWQGTVAADLAETWLDSYPEIAAVNCNNDGMALGIWPILEAKGRTDVLLYGHDGTPSTLQAIKEGKMTATVMVDIEGMINALFDAIEANNAGEEVDSIQYIQPILVTQENVEQYIN